jgi:hypothetical protein
VTTGAASATAHRGEARRLPARYGGRVSPTERVRVEQHGTSRIFVVDGTDVPATEYAGLLQAGAADRIKAYSTAIRPHVKASAVVGLSPLQRVIFQTLRPFMHATVRDFPTLAEARQWLLGFEKPAP